MPAVNGTGEARGRRASAEAGPVERDALERRQVWLYLVAVLAGLTLGAMQPAAGPVCAALVWPALALLLYATFVQVPLLHARAALADRRFLLAVGLGNFVLVPLALWLALPALPPEPALRLGVLLVLLMPCTDWFVTFARLGGGDTARALAVTPVNLLAQLALLPLYLWLMLPAGQLDAALQGPRLPAAALALVAAPLAAAVLTERWRERTGRDLGRGRLERWPVPLLTLTVFLVAASQVETVRQAGAGALGVLPVFAAYALLAAPAARPLAALLRLPRPAGRTLAFSLGTRNSFLVLPLALALPAGWEAVVVVVVLQSLVELFAMTLYLWWVPRRLFR